MSTPTPISQKSAAGCRIDLRNKIYDFPPEADQPWAERIVTMQKVYNKLIRDRIPEIIVNDGEEPEIRKLSQKEFKIELKKKVLEEAKELLQAESKEEILNEIVDIQELLDWLAKEFKISPYSIRNKKLKKNKERGGFAKRLFLVKTRLAKVRK